jgi:hypothetical protein
MHKAFMSSLWRLHKPPGPVYNALSRHSQPFLTVFSGFLVFALYSEAHIERLYILITTLRRSKVEILLVEKRLYQFYRLLYDGHFLVGDTF